MPELPEVETIKNDLKEILIGKKIIEIEVLESKTIGHQTRAFVRKITGRQIIGIRRRAKLIIMELTGQLFLVFHLKITGQLIIKKAAEKEKFTRVIFKLSQGCQLFFNDMRKFGYIKVFDSKGLARMLEEMKFGPEPLSHDFTIALFQERLEKRSEALIKPLLMDQTFLAGVGNIYASEACFRAGLKPTRRVKTLTLAEKKKIFQTTRGVLKESVRHRGTSADNYLDAHGQPGDFEKRLQVYGRKGEKCRRCPGIIVRVAQNGRGTFYCPKCQK